MFIHGVSHYLPTEVVTNDHFEERFGLTNEWLIERTGIEKRRKAQDHENSHTMGIAALGTLLENIQIDVEQIDLIVGATYTPYDLIVTLGHAIQHHLGIDDIPVVTISSACSSLLNAFEIVEGYFAAGKSQYALVISSEHNTAYYNVEDTKSNHLWGDGAVVMLVSKQRILPSDLKILDIQTGGAGNIGKAMEGVVLRPNNGGISMPYGKDVFIHACNYMESATRNIIQKNHLTVEDIQYFIPHQANLRITRHVAKELGLDESRVISNIQYLGNTGSAGCGIALSEHLTEFSRGDIIIMTVFGGGYSYGAMLVEA